MCGRRWTRSGRTRPPSSTPHRPQRVLLKHVSHVHDGSRSWRMFHRLKLSLIGPLASRRRVLGGGFPAAAACTARRQTRGVFAFKHFLSWLQLFPAQPRPHMQRAARASPGQEPRHVSGFSAGEGQPQSAAELQGDTIGSRPARRHHTWRMCPAWRRSRLIFEDAVLCRLPRAVD